MIRRVRWRVPLARVMTTRLLLAGLCVARTTHATPCTLTSLVPTCMVSSSITATPDSAREAKQRLRHEDREDSTLSATDRARRQAQSFDAQCWAVGAPVVVVTGGVLYAWNASADGRHRDTNVGALVALSGVVVGPAVGWVRAGYWDRAASSVGMRAMTMVGAMVMAGAIAGVAGLSGDAGLGVGLLGAGAGLSLIGLEMVLDVRHLGRHIRAHGLASEARVALLTRVGPGLAVTLPLH